ncbi:hypothetical protein [Streptomyces malaysiensis]|uniref:hypothetical protein n=1 Tax=Streptomyces malaysiensis TaxID=92644 RepID=UPI0033EE48D3
MRHLGVRVLDQDHQWPIAERREHIGFHHPEVSPHAGELLIGALRKILGHG